MNFQSFNDALASAFTWTWKISIQATVLIALVWLVQFVFKRVLAPRWRYALGLLVVIRMALPFTPSSSLSIFNLTAFGHRAAAVQLSPVNVQSPAKNFVPPSLPSPMPDASEKPPFPIIPALWLTGWLALLALAVRQQTKLARQLRGHKLVDDPKISALLRECKHTLRVRRKVGVVVTDALDTPALFGLFKPRLLVPCEMLERLDQRELRLVFLHELTHLKRGDLLVNWAVIIMRCLHWFNPLVWLAFKKLRADQELACDAAVMARLAGPERRLYGDTLIKLVARFSAAPICPSLVPFITKQKLIKRRITMIAKYKPTGKMAVLLSLVIIAALGVLTFTRASNQPATRGGIPAKALADNAANASVQSLAEKNRVIAALKASLEEMNAKIEATQDKLLELRKKLNIPADVADAQSASKLDKENLRHMQSVLVDAQTQYTLENRLYDGLSKLNPDDLREALPTAVPDALLNSQLAQLSDAETKLVTLRSGLGEQHPEVLTTKATVDLLNKKVNARIQGIMKGMEVKVTALHAVMDNAQNRLDTASKDDADAAASYRPYFDLKGTLEDLQRSRDAIQARLDQEKIDYTILQSEQ